MTSIATTTDAILERIHEAGYWRVVLHPSEYEERRIPTLSACEDLIEATKVRLRGWDYPHFERYAEATVRGDNWIQHTVDWAYYIELWRFYQSGQFVHHFAVHRDRTGPRGEGTPGLVRPGERMLDFVDAIYTLTEIFEFARGLAYRGVLDPVANIRVELHGTKGRTLAVPANRLLHGRYTATIDEITWCIQQPAAAVVADAPRLAIDAAMHIFERFNWPNPPRAVFEEDQRRLLERRL